MNHRLQLTAVALALASSLACTRPGSRAGSVTPAAVGATGNFDPSTDVGGAPGCANHAQARAVPGRYVPSRGLFLLDDSDGSQLVQSFTYAGADASLRAVAGDWDGDGFDSVGVHNARHGAFFLRNENSGGPANHTFNFGPAGAAWLPIAGDWDGDGRDSVGLYDPLSGTFYLRDALTGGNADRVIQFGPAPSTGLLPLAGDWDGDGKDGIGLFSGANGTFMLRDELSPGPANATFSFGAGGAGIQPATGDWDGDGRDGVASHDGDRVFYLRNALTSGNADRTFFSFGAASQAPGRESFAIAGRWRPARCRDAAHTSAERVPTWARDLILYQMRIETFVSEAEIRSPGAALAAAAARLPHVAELGATAVVLNPVQTCARTPGQDPRLDACYAVMKHDEVDPWLGGGAGLRAFTDEAHRLGLKVIVDNVADGIWQTSPYLLPGGGGFRIPDDWLRRDRAGQLLLDWGLSVQFDWSARELRDWYSGNVAVKWVRDYDVDGFRLDTEPWQAGTAAWERFRADILAATGKDVFLLTESRMTGRAYTMQMSQHDFGYSPPGGHADLRGFFEGGHDVVTELTAPEAKEVFYGSTLTDHDFPQYSAGGRLGPWAYGMLLAPVIPHFFMGEEFGAVKNTVPNSIPGFYGVNLYFSALDWNLKSVNAAYFNQVKQLIQIRKDHRAIVAPFEGSVNQTRLAAVTDYRGLDLRPYALWKDGTALVVAAKNRDVAGPQSLVVPLATMSGMGAFGCYDVRNLLTGAATPTQQPLSRAAMDQPIPASLAPTLPAGGALVLKVVGRTSCPHATI